MKKTLFVSTLIILTILSAEAQTARVGIKGGVNLANLGSKDDFDSKTGFHAGFYGEFGVVGFAIQPEILFSIKGSKDIDLSYVEIPILFKKSFARIINIQVGPQLGILVASKDKIDADNAYKSSDISVVFGLGLDLPKGISVGGRYVLGLTAIEETGNISKDGVAFPETKNKTFQIYLGYKLFGK